MQALVYYVSLKLSMKTANFTETQLLALLLQTVHLLKLVYFKTLQQVLQLRQVNSTSCKVVQLLTETLCCKLFINTVIVE